jgi:integrase
VSPWIIKRRTLSGVRYEVRFRLGGRGPQLYGGRFKRREDARRRARWIAGELAAMRVPNLRALRDQGPVRPLSAWGAEWADSRIDVSAATRENYRKHMARWGALGRLDPQSVSPSDVVRWVSTLGDLAPSSVKRYVTTLRQVLDFAGADPNPARDERVRLPKVERVEVEPPSGAEVQAIVAAIRPRWQLPVRLLEATGMRVGELAGLTWGDVDWSTNRLRVREGKTAAARRWVQVPEHLMGEIGLVTPPDDRTAERRIFSMTGQDLRQAMRRACESAGIPLYSPHDLRHRRVSVWHREGVPFREIAQRVGHSRTSLTMDTYAHVILSEEDE